MLIKRPSLLSLYPKIRLDKLLSETARKYPDKDIVTYPRKITYPDFNNMVNRLSTGLYKLGVEKGSHIMIFSPNSIEYEIALFSISRVGGIIVPVNPMLKSFEMEYIISDSEISGVFTTKNLYSIFKEALNRSGRKLNLIITLDQKINGGYYIYDLIKKYSSNPPKVDVDPVKDLVSINYTSGTTATPKGVMLNHFGRVINGVQGSLSYDVSDVDVIMFNLPMYHIYGFGFILTQCIFGGASQIILAGFNPKEYCELIEKYKATILFIVPPMLNALIAYLEKSDTREYDWSSVRMCFSGAAPLAPSLAEKFKETASRKCKSEVIMAHGWGLTETGPWIAGSPLYRVKDISSPGIATYDHEFKVIDPSSGKVLSSGEIGEIIVHSPTMMTGYWKKDPNEGFITINGKKYVRTGDLGYIDDEGYHYLVDRIKEIIKYKGYTVAPFELEALLLTHPAVHDVAVIGRPDPVAGEVPKAYVVLKKEYIGKIKENALIKWMKDKIAAYKRVREIEFIDTIPRTGSGKILRRVLKQREIEKQKKKLI